MGDMAKIFDVESFAKQIHKYYGHISLEEIKFIVIKYLSTTLEGVTFSDASENIVNEIIIYDNKEVQKVGKVTI